VGGAYTRSGLIPGGHTGDQAARREASIQKIRELLTEMPHSCFDLSAAVGIPSSTVYNYLRTMQEDGEVYQMDALDDRGRKTWAADSEALQAATDRAAAEHSKRAWVVPARQIGMPHDPLVAALFGPAQMGAAA
jgi:hypothetical protein